MIFTIWMNQFFFYSMASNCSIISLKIDKVKKQQNLVDYSLDE